MPNASLSQLISNFRKIQSKDGVSPDSLGYLLQCIVDNVGASDVVTTPETVPSEVPPFTAISCDVVNGVLRVHGARDLIKAGYVPYLFRLTSKRNAYRHKPKYRMPGDNDRKRCQKSKGWHCFGSCNMLRIDDNDIVCFSGNNHQMLHDEARSFSNSVECLMKPYTASSGIMKVPWGRKCVSLTDRHGLERMLRFRFAIGFGRKFKPGNFAVKPSSMITPLAEFSVIYNPEHMGDKWQLSK